METRRQKGNKLSVHNEGSLNGQDTATLMNETVNLHRLITKTAPITMPLRPFSPLV